MKQQHKIILEKQDIELIIKQITKNETAKLVTSIGSIDADMNPVVELTFTLDAPTQQA